MSRVTSVIVGGLSIILVAISASAAPPIFIFQNRTSGTWADGSRCDPTPYGQRCNSISVTENYNVKGLFQNSEVTVLYSIDEWYDDGSWLSGWRVLNCQIDRKAISVYPNNRVTVEAIMDREAPECDTFGSRYACDPEFNCEETPWSFPFGPRELEGEWLDPFTYGTSTWVQQDIVHDGWSGSANTTRQNCMRRWGEMALGGFRLGKRSFAFEGVGGPTWSSFSSINCNEHNQQR